MKHEVLDCSFEMLESGGWWWNVTVTGSGTGGWWCYPLLFAINTARFYTSTQSNSTARGGNTFIVKQALIKSNNGKKQAS